MSADEPGPIDDDAIYGFLTEDVPPKPKPYLPSKARKARKPREPKWETVTGGIVSIDMHTTGGEGDGPITHATGWRQFR